MAEKKIGKVIHYYDKIGVAVVKLTVGLSVGDEIKVVKGNKEFSQKVESLQVEHKPIKKAKKGEEVAIKVGQEAKRGAEVFLIS